MSALPKATSTTSVPKGDRVDVWSPFTQRWARGFTVAGVDDRGYTLVRAGDSTPLPVPIPHERVRESIAPSPVIPRWG